MLVIKRKPGERIKIVVDGKHEIWLTLCDIGTDRGARIGLEAPKSVKIMREELLPLEERYDDGR